MEVKLLFKEAVSLPLFHLLLPSSCYQSCLGEKLGSDHFNKSGSAPFFSREIKESKSAVTHRNKEINPMRLHWKEGQRGLETSPLFSVDTWRKCPFMELVTSMPSAQKVEIH